MPVLRTLAIVLATACIVPASAVGKSSETSGDPGTLHLVSPPPDLVPFDKHLLLRVRAALAGLATETEVPNDTPHGKGSGEDH